MADSTTVRNIRITCEDNGPQNALKRLQNQLKKVQKDMENLDKTSADYQERLSALQKTQRSYESAIRYTENEIQKVEKVTTDLANATGRQLRSALRVVKKEMANTSDTTKLKEVREQYDAINRQIKILEGSLKDISGEMGNLQNKTMGWLDSAIAQQQKYVASLDEENDQYKEQVGILEKLKAAKDDKIMSNARDGWVEAEKTINNPSATLPELRDARQKLLTQQQYLPLSNKQDLATINADLAKCDELIGELQGKEKQIVLTEEQMATKMSAFADKVKAGNASPKELRENLAECRAQLDKMATGSTGRQKWVQWAKQFESALGEVKNEGVNVQKVLGNLKGASLNDLRAAAAKLKEEMAGIERNSKQFNDVKQQFNQINAELNRASNAINGINKSTSAWKTTLRNLTTYFGLFQIFSKVASWLQDIVKGNLKMSDQLSQIRMVSGLAMKQVNQLSDSLRGIDTRTTLSDLQNIAYEGSKLGMGQYGVEGLKGFTEAANELNVALKEQMGDDTLTAMSKMVENMGLIKKMGVEQALKATGSAMFMLSSSSTATAGNIVEFTKRLYALAKSANITTPELLALGSASDSFGLMPEVAATAMNKFITQIQKAPGAIEQAIGVPQGTIDNLYKAGRTMDAVLVILQRLHDMGRSRVKTFKALGSEGSRMNVVFTSMAENVDVLRRHLQISNQAFEEGTAVSQEYSLRQETAEGYMERANNLWAKSFINTNGVDTMKDFARQWYELSAAMTSNAATMTILKGLFAFILGQLKMLMEILPAILAGLMFKGVVATVQALATGIGLMGENAVVATWQTQGLAAAWTELNAVQKTNLISLAITLLATLAIGIYKVVQAGNNMQGWMQGFDPTMKEFNREFEKSKAELDLYTDAIRNSAKGTNEHRAAIENFNNKYGQYLDHLITEKNAANELANAYAKVVKQLRSKILLELRDKDMEKEYYPRVGWSVDKLDAYDQKVAGTRYAANNGAWLKGFVDDMRKSGKSISDIANSLNRRVFHLNSKQLQSTKNSIGIPYWDGVSTPNIDMDASVSHDSKQLEEILLHRALRYATQFYSAENSRDKVINKYKPFEGDILPDDSGTTTNGENQDLSDTGTGGKNGKTGRTGRTGTGNSPKEQLDIAKKQVDGLVSNIESYYNNQMAAVEDMVAQGQKSRAQADMYLNTLKIQQNKALQQARLAISGQANNWDEFKDNEMGLTKDWVDVGRGTEELSKYLLDAIRKADVGSIQKVLTNLEGGRDILREVITNATKNGYEINKLLAEIQQKAMQAMYQYDYLNTYFKDSESDMIQAGFVSNTDRSFFEAPPTPKVDKTDNEGKGKGSRFDNPNNPISLQDAVVMGPNLSPYRQMMKQYVQNSSRYLQYNPNDDVQLYQFLQDIASGGNLNENGGAKELTGWAKNFSQMTNKDKTGWLDILGTTGVDPENDLEVENIKQKIAPIRDSIRAYFNFLFDQDNKYYTDVIEKQEQRAAKIISSRWDNSVDKIQFDVRDRQLKQQKDNEDVFGRPQRFWQPWGFSDTIRKNDVDMNQAVNNAKSARIQYQQAQSFMTSRERINDKKQVVTNAYAEQNAAQSALDNLQQNATPDSGQNAQNQKAAQDRLDKAKDALEKAQNDLALEQSKILAPETLKKYEDAWTNAQKEIGTLVNQYVTNRIETLKQWTDPIEQLGTAMGEAFATMTEDAEKGRDAVKAALLDMVKAYGQATIKILNELMMEKVKEMLLRKTYGKENAKIEKENNEKINDSAKDSGKSKTSILTKAWKGIKNLFKKQKKDEVKETQDKQKATQDVEQKGADAKEVLNVETGKKIADATSQIDTQALQQKEQNTKQDVADESNKTQANTTLGIASGASKIIAKLGWWGIPLVAVITALLNGLLSFALSKVSSLFGGGSKDSGGGTNTKLVSGMLTYDAGNVQAFSGVDDGKTYPVVGNDGKVYAAKDGGELSTGLVKDPITTLVNGQPALVAERGPEMVIGRETTAAMMMARPDLISEIVKFDRNRSGMNYRVYDAGNVQGFASGDGSVDMVALMNGITKMNETGEMLAQVLAVIQANGIQAHINKYGRGGLATQAADGADFMRRNSGDRLWKK